MDRIFCLPHQLQAMTRFEAALTAALEANGLASPGAAQVLASLEDAAFVDVPVLLEQSLLASNLAIPFVRQLTEAVRLRDPQAAASVHRGATSQDVLDTAQVLQLREALDPIRRDLDAIDSSLVTLARTHAGTLLAGRTWLQQGPPITLGLKVAGWIEALRRHRRRIDAAAAQALVLQFGGAVGTLSALGDRGLAVSAHLARTLNLPEPRVPWHTHRDALVDLAAAFGLLVGTLGKIARDVSLLMQTEVGEVFEPVGEGRGGSSTMPHKRNPVASAVILAIATRTPGLVATLLTAMVQEHERGLGGWQAEWETIPEIVRLAAAALARTREIAAGLEVHPERMAANLDATHGLVMAEAVSVALAEKLGRTQAHHLLEQASRRALAEGRSLREVLREIPEVGVHLSSADLDRLFDPRRNLGSAQAFLARVLGEVPGEPDGGS